MPDATIDLTPDSARQMFEEIAKLDEVIEASSGNAEAGKRSLANSIATDTEAQWKKLVDQLTNTLEKQEDDRLLVGTITAIQKSLGEKFKERTDKFLTELQEANKADTSLQVSGEQLEQIVTERREKVKIYNTFKSMLEMLGHDIKDLPTPSSMKGPRGKTGPRGPRLPKNMILAIDGKDRSATTNTLSSIAATVCQGEEFGESKSWNTAELKEWMKSQGFDFENVPETFSYKLPNGKTLSGRLDTSPEATVPDEEEENEEETNEEQ